MRNEGPFVIEWLCWYRMLGFTDAVVVTNACTDHSPELLDAMEQAGWVHHLRHEVPQGQPITPAKLRVARDHRAVKRADWVMVCDVDEFLVIHRGEGKLADLIGPGFATGEVPFLGMSINWRVFGTDGRKRYDDSPVHRQFFGALRASRNPSGFVKSVFRKPKWFGALGEHGPRGLKLDRAGRDWGAPGMVWVNAQGIAVPQWQPEAGYLRLLPPSLTSHEVAQINHYMLRSDESFSLKRGTLSPVALANRYDAAYRARANHADVIDASALRYTTAFDALYLEAMALPGVRRLHHLCCADYVRMICEKAGLDPRADPRWQRHMDMAAQ